MSTKNYTDKDQFFEIFLPQQKSILMSSHQTKSNEKSFRFWCLLVLIVLILLIVSIYMSGQNLKNSTKQTYKDYAEVENGMLQDSSGSSSLTASKDVLREHHEMYRDERSASASAASTNSASATPKKAVSPRAYYEEQQPVVVHAENGLSTNVWEGYKPSYLSTQSNQDSYYSYVLPNDHEGDHDGDDNTEYDDIYDYGPQDDNYPDGAELTDSEGKGLSSQGSSSNSDSSYGSSYRPWYYGNAYDDYGFSSDYDYPSMGPESKAYPKPQWGQPKQKQQQPPFYRTEYQPRLPENSQKLTPASTSISSALNPWDRPKQQQPTTLLSVVKQLKTMWDLYKAFTAAWNVVAEHSQKREEQKQQQQKQQQEEKQAQIKQQKAKQQQKQLPGQSQKEQRTRLNTRRPSATETQRRTSTTKATAATATTTSTTIRKTKTTRRRTTTTKSTTISPMAIVAELPPAKVEPRTAVTERKGSEKRQHTQSHERKKRQSDDQQQEQQVTSTTDSAVAEGRYIKGDPLKGYYDFVITEGSYKFWAVFQVGTAILVIYSTFAAIYYSKVNPLVSDYDYTDYLGGARSLSSSDGHDGDDDVVDGNGSSDVDFVDDDVDNDVGGSMRNGHRNSRWFSSMKHSMKFILDAINSLPADHGK